MAHYRSTLATTAVAVAGLVAAAHILHPGNYETRTRAVRPDVASALAPGGAMGWADPPARPRVEPAAVAQVQDVAALPAPRTMTALTSDDAVEQPPRATVASRSGRSRKAGTADRRKFAQRAVRGRQASLGGGTPIEPPAMARPAPREMRTSDRIDPIGDLIRGLGLGREG